MSESGDIVDGTYDRVNRGSSSPAHWVEDLFPPTFRLSLPRPDHGTSITTAVLDQHGCDCDLPAESETGGTNNEELFAKLARGISPLDVASIKNVYERVWLMMHETGATASSK